MRNGQEPLITATGQMLAGKRLADNALLHVNMIAELSPALAPAFPEFAAGDMVISVRDHNLIFLVDPRD